MRRALLAGLAFLAACASVEPGNPPLARYAPQEGYRFERLAHEGHSDELFVIVTFSGGGTRAAALAFGVLEALRDTRIAWRGRRVSLLEEVDVISSISGGSFPAAYYALRGEKTFEARIAPSRTGTSSSARSLGCGPRSASPGRATASRCLSGRCCRSRSWYSLAAAS